MKYSEATTLHYIWLEKQRWGETEAVHTQRACQIRAGRTLHLCESLPGCERPPSISQGNKVTVDGDENGTRVKNTVLKYLLRALLRINNIFHRPMLFVCTCQKVGRKKKSSSHKKKTFPFLGSQSDPTCPLNCFQKFKLSTGVPWVLVFFFFFGGSFTNRDTFPLGVKTVAYNLSH